MTINLKAIRAAAETVKALGNCNKAWLDTAEDETAAIVGAVCEEGVRYPVATVDCDQYDHGGDSLPLAKFYATANPETVIALLDRLEAAEKDAARMNWLEQNLFNRENIDWLTKKPCTKFNMWVLFSPKGVQGSARGIIDAAMGEQT